VPLAVSVSAGNRNDVTQLEPLIEGIGPVRGKRGRPRKRPEALYGDRAYDHDVHRRRLRRRGVKPIIACRGAGHGSGLGRVRWVVERTFAWLHSLRRLRIRYERCGALHTAFLKLGAAVICQRLLP
jgi:transposase